MAVTQATSVPTLSLLSAVLSAKKPGFVSKKTMWHTCLMSTLQGHSLDEEANNA